MSLIEQQILSMVTQFLSYIFSLMFASMISGIVVTIDKQGRVRDTSGKFVGFERAFALIFLDMVISALLVQFASVIVQNLLIKNVRFIFAITGGMFLVFELWYATHSASALENIGYQFLSLF